MNFQLKCGVALAALCVVSPAYAQAGPNQAADDRARDDIIVTGTLIRGVAPAGTEPITVDQQDIVEAGGVTTNDVLAKVPQVGFFNRQPSSGNDAGVGQQQKANQPSIHGLPTLVMLDGHRIASAASLGSGSATPNFDPSIIPTGALTGIEIVPDGGSALYGSDAIGGVINLTTLKRFDGLKVDGNIGFADNYTSYRASATAGKDWGSGSIFAAYSYNKANALLGSDRDYLVRNPLRTGCAPTGTITNPAVRGGAPGVSYTFTGVDANGKAVGYAVGQQGCNNYLDESVLPSETLHSAFAGLSQDLNSAIHVDLRAFYSVRRSTSFFDNAVQAENVNVPKSNAFYTPTPAELAAPSRSQVTSFTLSEALGRANTTSTNKIETWGVSSEFKADVGGSFQVRLLGSYSESSLKGVSNDGMDSGLLAQALADSNPATAFNPYSPAATPGSIAVAKRIAARQATNYGLVQQTQARLVTDGTLFQIGGGDVKIAAGGELLHERFNSSLETVNFAGALLQPRQDLAADRTVLSAFGELEVPLISPESNGPIYGLYLNAAARYDHYNDFGSTFNPRFGASLMPVEWLTFRGSYGRSFVAPALGQLYAPRQGFISTSSFLLPGFPFDPDNGRKTVVLTGGNVSLQPQKSTTWTLGLDVKAPFAEGLRASVTYYNVNFKNLLGNPPAIGAQSVFFTPLYQDFWIKNPTLQQAQAFADGVPVAGAGFTSLEQLYGPNGETTADSPAYIITNRASNLGIQKTSGIDFDVNFQQPTSFGSLDFGVAGNYILKLDDSAVAGAPFTNSLATEMSRFRGVASFGANVGNFRFSTRLLHTDGFELDPNGFNQARVKAFNTVDAFLSYTFEDEGYLDDTVVTVNATNLFDVRPPVNRTSSTGYDTGSILGRMIQLGLSKKF